MTEYSSSRLGILIQHFVHYNPQHCSSGPELIKSKNLCVVKMTEKIVHEVVQILESVFEIISAETFERAL